MGLTFTANRHQPWRRELLAKGIILRDWQIVVCWHWLLAYVDREGCREYGARQYLDLTSHQAPIADHAP